MTNQEILAHLRMLESNNGKNFNHPTITQGLDKGTQAAGNYGLTGSTINDVIKNNPHYTQLMAMAPVEKKQYIESHPEDESNIANSLIDRLQQRYAGDPSKIAYAWNHGTYINPNKITPDILQHDQYTNNFQKLGQNLRMKDPSSFQNVERRPAQNPIQENIAQQTNEVHPSSSMDEQSIRDFINDPSNPFNEDSKVSENDEDDDNTLLKKYAGYSSNI